jgi:excisionase family DNA binding protein
MPKAALVASPPLLKLAQVAKALGVAAITVRRRVADGSLGHVRIQGRLYFKEAHLRAFVDGHSHSGAPDRS